MPHGAAVPHSPCFPPVRAGEEMSISRISLIVPMLNEADHVEGFLDDVADQDFQGEVELLVADGGSTDGSPDLLRGAAERRGVELVTLHNDAGWVSRGLNACIRAATGDLLVRLDCHSRYPPDYLRRCATAAEATGAQVVGGIIVAGGRTRIERSVACAMDSPFGGIGFYRVLASDAGPLARLAGTFGLARGRNVARTGRVDTDTLTFGAFRPEAFQLAGVFDESLRRNQDDEFNLRVRLAGGRVVLDPAIRVFYKPRGSLRKVFQQYFDYGYWKVAVMAKHRQLPGPRSLVPLALLGSVGVLALLGTQSPTARRLLWAELALYGGLAAASAAATVRARGESPDLLPSVAAVFPAFHLGYGSGMLVGFMRAAGLALRGRPLTF
jgi:succinoglycan biosynthesis protein ExoA